MELEKIVTVMVVIQDVMVVVLVHHVVKRKHGILLNVNVLNHPKYNPRRLAGIFLFNF